MIVLNPKDPNFEDDLKFNIWSTQSSSDYRNDRDRPYNGQKHTIDGIRGKQMVTGLTIRDLKDCLIKAMLVSAPDTKYLEIDEISKCWDYSQCKSDDSEKAPTQYLIDKQREGKYASTKVETNNWRPQDVYNLDWSNIDPIAITQNLGVEIEKMMGIFPNI
jgi:hypothetical protein